MTKKLFVIAVVLSLTALPAAAEEGTGDAVTLWGVFFNNPGACSDGVCGEDDVFGDPGPPQTAVVFLSGQRISSNGRASYGASYGEGSTVGALPLPTNSLIDAQSAEIHLVLRTHGRYLPELADEQITTFGGGCDVQTCEDVQGAVFRPQDADASGRQTSKVVRFSDGAEISDAWATLWREADGIRVAIHTRYRGSGSAITLEPNLDRRRDGAGIK